MDRERSLRQHLGKLLDWEDAHATVDQAVDGIPPRARGVVPEGSVHSAWQLLEHLRIAQHDILDFCRNPKYVEMPMADLWPRSPQPPSGAAWKTSVAALRRDRAALARLARNPRTDLFARIPHGSGQTYLRELLLAADHAAYHAGQLVALRRQLGVWKG
ncbi:MAG TPA: DinB family protein [Vicinamibacteria bacterium]|jgi:uncharacterized damage-inducible protein DinB|nr:DinB family protein [Vicinamibacteria bacterium]